MVYSRLIVIFFAVFFCVNHGIHGSLFPETSLVIKRFFHHSVSVKNTTTPLTTHCTREKMKKCPKKPESCPGPDRVWKKWGEDYCCDICYTILGEHENCNNLENPYTECAGVFLCVNGICQ